MFIARSARRTHEHGHRLYGCLVRRSKFVVQRCVSRKVALMMGCGVRSMKKKKTKYKAIRTECSCILGGGGAPPPSVEC